MYKIADPIPSASVFHTGRGGAGNYRKASTKVPTAPLSTVSTNTASNNRVFWSGRGGAGNLRPTSERAVFSFDEELEREQMIREHQPPVFSIGRGGSGNMVASENSAAKSFYSGKGSGEFSRVQTRASQRSNNSTASGPLERVRSGADKLWDRLKF